MGIILRNTSDEAVMIDIIKYPSLARHNLIWRIGDNNALFCAVRGIKNIFTSIYIFQLVSFMYYTRKVEIFFSNGFVNN